MGEQRWLGLGKMNLLPPEKEVWSPNCFPLPQNVGGPGYTPEDTWVDVCVCVHVVMCLCTHTGEQV